MSQQKPLVDWNNQPITVKPKPTPMTNPLIARFGAGEEGVSCSRCVHLCYTQGYRRKRYWCDEVASIRKKDDNRQEHMPGWPACSRYKQRTEPYFGG